MAMTRHHAEWLALIEVSGPFLSLPVLESTFPQGLAAIDNSSLRQDLRLAFEEWKSHQQAILPDVRIHREWVRFILDNVLELPEEVLVEDNAIPAPLTVVFKEQGETLSPTFSIVNPADGDNPGKPRLLVCVYPVSQNLNKAVSGQAWKASPATRMQALLHATDNPLGLATNGEQWMLVHAPRGETTTFATWYAGYWLDEPITLRAFINLLGVQRWFGVPDDQRLPALFAKSAAHQQEVTDRLGLQVRRAVEILIQSLDRVDKDRQQTLLQGVDERRLYNAGLTLMMRLVFMLFAEERGLLLLENPIYDQHYAVATLRAQLREQADQVGEATLERRYDAWSRLLAAFRMVHAGVHYEDLRLPAYGGHLFDPDRYPFL